MSTIFQELYNRTTHIKENQIYVLERFFIFACYPKKCSTENINLEKMNAYNKTPNCNLLLLPFSKFSLLEQIKRTAF